LHAVRSAPVSDSSQTEIWLFKSRRLRRAEKVDGRKPNVMSPDYGCCPAAEIAASDIELCRLPTPQLRATAY
jgi:hypothetical protein